MEDQSDRSNFLFASVWIWDIKLSCMLLYEGFFVSIDANMEEDYFTWKVLNWSLCLLGAIKNNLLRGECKEPWSTNRASKWTQLFIDTLNVSIQITTLRKTCSTSVMRLYISCEHPECVFSRVSSGMLDSSMLNISWDLSVIFEFRHSFSTNYM